jgi:hypothetical protein
VNPNKKHSAGALKQEFADVAFALENANLEMQMNQKFGFQGHIEVTGKTAKITIPLSGGHTLTFTPVDLTFDGYSTWYEWLELFNPMTGENTKFANIRAAVSIESEDPKFASLTFTIYARNLNQLVDIALKKTKKYRMKRLNALLIEDIEANEI